MADNEQLGKSYISDDWQLQNFYAPYDLSTGFYDAKFEATFPNDDNETYHVTQRDENGTTVQNDLLITYDGKNTLAPNRVNRIQDKNGRVVDTLYRDNRKDMMIAFDFNNKPSQNKVMIAYADNQAIDKILRSIQKADKLKYVGGFLEKLPREQRFRKQILTAIKEHDLITKSDTLTDKRKKFLTNRIR